MAGETCGGGYFASLRDELPGQPQPVPESFAGALAFGKEMVWQQAISID